MSIKTGDVFWDKNANVGLVVTFVPDDGDAEETTYVLYDDGSSDCELIGILNNTDHYRKVGNIEDSIMGLIKRVKNLCYATQEKEHIKVGSIFKDVDALEKSFIVTEVPTKVPRIHMVTCLCQDGTTRTECIYEFIKKIKEKKYVFVGESHLIDTVFFNIKASRDGL